LRVTRGQQIAVKRPTQSSDGQGGYTEGFATIATERGHIRPASSSEIVRAGQEKGRMTHVAYIRAGSSVEFGDVLVIANPALRLEVTGVRKPSNTASGQMEIDCKAIQK
jgi:head-tail adaptor